MKLAPFLRSAVSSFIIFSFLLFSSGIVLSASGAIWTTSGSCGTPQNVNHYPSGSTIYINGDNFNANTLYSWDISDPGNGNSTTYLSGNVTANGVGAFCFAAGVVPDGGPYQAKVSNVKGDNFSIDGLNPTATPTSVPTATAVPSSTPTAIPSASPTFSPTATPTTVPSSTPSASPTASPFIEIDQTPTPSPVLGDSDTNEDVCANIDGVQTSVPNDYHLDASGLNCVQFSQSGAGDGGNGGNGQVLGTSTIGSTGSSTNKQGQVLGASTLGATGTDQKLMIALYILGGLAISCGVGVYSFSKEDLVVDMDSRI